MNEVEINKLETEINKTANDWKQTHAHMRKIHNLVIDDVLYGTNKFTKPKFKLWHPLSAYCPNDGNKLKTHEFYNSFAGGWTYYCCDKCGYEYAD